MSYGITPQGYARKDYNYWLDQFISKVRLPDYFGTEIDLSDSQPMGVLLRIMALGCDELTQELEDIYYNMYPDSAEGVSLDRAIGMVGIQREPETFATVELVFDGDKGARILTSHIFSTSKGVEFSPLANVQIDENKKASVLAQCTQAGTVGMVPSGSITTITTPIEGVYSVNNPKPSGGGKDKMNDAQYRALWRNKRMGSAASISAIIAEVTAVEGVNSAYVYVNSSGSIDDEERPPHSVEVVVDGGQDEDVGMALYRRYCGLQYVGSHTVSVKEELNGQYFTMAFNRPTNMEIYIFAKIQTEIFAQLKEIKASIVSLLIRHIGGMENGAEYAGMDAGATLYSYELEAAIGKLEGLKDIELTISKENNGNTTTRQLKTKSYERPRVHQDTIFFV